MYAKNELDLKFQIMDQKIDAKFDTFGQRMENMFLAQTNRQLEEQAKNREEQAKNRKEFTYWFISILIALAGIAIPVWFGK